MQVEYYVAEPGTVNMRDSLADTCTTSEKEDVAKAQSLISQALADLVSQKDSAALLSQALSLSVKVVSRSLRRDLVTAIYAYSQAHGSLGSLFGDDSSQATAEVLSSGGQAEACTQRESHDLHHLRESIAQLISGLLIWTVLVMCDVLFCSGRHAPRESV